MASLRPRLPLCAAIWLVFQLAWLAVFVPRDCCAAHRPAERRCHESPPVAHCSMNAADERPCDMHRSHEDAAALSRPAEAPDHTTPLSGSRCRLSAVCEGPMAALGALLSNHGILPGAAGTLPTLVDQSAGIIPAEDLLGRFESPDPPPPRA